MAAKYKWIKWVHLICHLAICFWRPKNEMAKWRIKWVPFGLFVFGGPKKQMAKWRIKWAPFDSLSLVEQIKCALGSFHLVWPAQFKWPKGRRLVHLVWSAKPKGGSNERHLVHLVWSIKPNGGSNGRHLIHLVWGNKPNGTDGHYLIHWVWRAKRQKVK